MKIRSTTVEINDIISFEFIAPGVPGEDSGTDGGPCLRADFADGHSETAHGDEAVTLKVLLASLGVRDLSVPAQDPSTPAPAIPAENNPPSNPH